MVYGHVSEILPIAKGTQVWNWFKRITVTHNWGSICSLAGAFSIRKAERKLIFITNEELNSNGVFYPGGNSAGQTAGPADLRHNRKHLRFVTLTSLLTTTCGLYPNSSNPKKVKSCFPSPGWYNKSHCATQEEWLWIFGNPSGSVSLYTGWGRYFLCTILVQPPYGRLPASAFVGWLIYGTKANKAI